TSWHSTIVYYRLINELVAKKMGAQGNPDLIIYSLNIELMREQNWEKINRAYLKIARKLETAGAKAIMICANTPHKVFDFVQPRIHVPILHIADAIAKEAKNKGVKVLGLLGNKPTMTGGFLQKRLKENYNIDVIIPDDEYLDESHSFVSKELTQGKFTETARFFFIDQMQLLKEKGAQGIILGCTELPLLIGQEDFDLPLIKTTHLHAKMAADFILEPAHVTS
ncbi:MAG: amino acid racemase, partial [Salinimicrobium sp.]